MKKRVTHEIPIDAPESPVDPTVPGPGSSPQTRQDVPSGAAPAEPPAGARKPDYQEAVNHLQRLQAEFANYRRRTERERLETVEFAQHALIEKLVPVLDDFERAIAALEDLDSPAAKGLTLIWEKFSKTLADAGLDRIETTGKTFDPTLHEALTTQPVEPDRAEQVLEELVPGYTFRNRLVRPARVCVGVEAPRTGDDSPRR